MHTGVIHGGTALNIVPRDCWFDFEVRHLPADDPDELFAEVKDYAQRFLPEMHRVASDAYIEFDALSATSGFDTGDGERDRQARPAVQRRRTGTARCRSAPRPPVFHSAAIPSIICGPGHIAQAHQPNEWVAVEQLARCETFMRRLAERICVS